MRGFLSINVFNFLSPGEIVILLQLKFHKSHLLFKKRLLEIRCPSFENGYLGLELRAEL